MQFISTNSKKTIIARFDEGEDLLKSLKELAEKNNIKCGWFNVIGGLKIFTYGLYENGEYRKIIDKAKHCFELLPTFGNITLKEGEVLIHAHVNATDEDKGVGRGGHLLEGSIIYPFAEVIMQECEGKVGRVFDEKTKLWPIKF